MAPRFAPAATITTSWLDENRLLKGLSLHLWIHELSQAIPSLSAPDLPEA